GRAGHQARATALSHASAANAHSGARADAGHHHQKRRHSEPESDQWRCGACPRRAGGRQAMEVQALLPERRTGGHRDPDPGELQTAQLKTSQSLATNCAQRSRLAQFLFGWRLAAGSWRLVFFVASCYRCPVLLLSYVQCSEFADAMNERNHLITSIG